MQAIHLIIQGKVQGVGYRRWFEQQAIQLGLKGFVRNLETGEVEAVIVGKEAIVRGNDPVQQNWTTTCKSHCNTSAEFESSRR